MEGGLAVGDAAESCFSGLSFCRSLSLSFLKMWASWTISVFGGDPSLFFFFFLFGGDRTSTKAVETRKSGLNHGSDLEKAPRRGSREDRVGAKMKIKKKRRAEKVYQKKKGQVRSAMIRSSIYQRLTIGH